jgi:hypothetical protein
VYGGNGITPDVPLDSETTNGQRVALLDPIFFFVREVVNSRSTSITNPISAPDQVRQSIIFGNEPAGQELLKKFLDYANRPGSNVSVKAVRENAAFIAERLNYELALATFGPGSAKHAQIMSDVEISKAIEALPRAARLAENARQARVSTENKKTRRVAFPTGQGRNRRN